MKLFIDIVMNGIYLFNIVARNYRKKRGFLVCKKENFAGLQAHRKRGKSARASPTPHHTLNEERSARFTAQPLSALLLPFSAPPPERPGELTHRLHQRVLWQSRPFCLISPITDLSQLWNVMYVKKLRRNPPGHLVILIFSGQKSCTRMI